MRRALATAAGLALGCAPGGPAGHPGPAAVASGTLHDSAGERVGVVVVTDTAGSLRLAVSVGGLTPGPHGLHLHAVGRCAPPDFTSAGPHFNPDGRQHGRLNPAGPHAGDLPNLLVHSDGSADTSFALPGVTVTGPHGLRQAGGLSVVLHANADDERTDPSGNAGARVACAVLEPG